MRHFETFAPELAELHLNSGLNVLAGNQGWDGNQCLLDKWFAMNAIAAFITHLRRLLRLSGRTQR